MELRTGLREHASVALSIDQRYARPLFECAQVTAHDGMVEPQIESRAATRQHTGRAGE